MNWAPDLRKRQISALSDRRRREAMFRQIPPQDPHVSPAGPRRSRRGRHTLGDRTPGRPACSGHLTSTDALPEILDGHHRGDTRGAVGPCCGGVINPVPLHPSGCRDERALRWQRPPPGAVPVRAVRRGSGAGQPRSCLRCCPTPVRLWLFAQIALKEGETCVCGMPRWGLQPTVSHHLRKLREAGVRGHCSCGDVARAVRALT
jgi:hypothetical protein